MTKIVVKMENKIVIMIKILVKMNFFVYCIKRMAFQ